MSMEEVIHAALYGPEVKKLKVYDHEFNVKPVERSRAGSRLIVSGQISHCLSLRPDDQVYYTIVLENAVIQPTLSRCGSRKNYIPSPEDLIDSSRCSEEGCLWKPSALNAWTI
jgi:hypothetical protein